LITPNRKINRAQVESVLVDLKVLQRMSINISPALHSPTVKAIPVLTLVATVRASRRRIKLSKKTNNTNSNAEDMRAVVSDINRMPEAFLPWVTDLFCLHFVFIHSTDRMPLV